jgi:O-succinylbenzoic acid--CoA ligase
MVIKSPRKLIEVPSTWSIPEQIKALNSALSGDGPALAFGASNFEVVDSEIAVVIQTSGSTGSAKEVALSATALMESARASHQFLQANHGDTWSLLLPTHHIAGVNVLVRAIVLGSELVSSHYDYTSIVPTQLFRALNGDQQLLTALKESKAVLVGGGAIQKDLLTLAKEVGINVVTSYGMSEMSGGCIYDGLPLQGVEIQIQNDGRIALRGPMRATEYLGVTTPLADSEGWFVTDDAGELAEGRLVVKGRLDDQIISGGEKISLGAIDEFLNAGGEYVFMSCAIAHPEWGQQLCLASSMRIDRRAITNALRNKFGKHAVAKLFLENITLPVTTIGKPDRQTLSRKFEMIAP